MRAFLRSFQYAFRGITTAVKEERNMRFHLCAAVYMYALSLFYGFGVFEYIALTLLVVGVLTLELINSAFERTVDRLSPQRNRNAGVIKDMAAGAVLVFCIGAVVCGVLLFWDVAVFRRILGFFMARWWMWAVLAATLASSAWFVFFYNRQPKGTQKGEKK